MKETNDGFIFFPFFERRCMASPLPPLNSLRAFECAARHLSFTKAADELNITQSAVSHQIKTLEA
jgi:LysR family glycine cleavage system transcriptional activator